VALNCKTAIVERNISDVEYIEAGISKPVTLYYEHCGSLRVFRNQTPDGIALQAFDKSLLGPIPPGGARKNQFRNNLGTDADLAVLSNL
jgi:hypothetical protein